MAPEEYRKALDAAIREYEQLGAQRREIDERLTRSPVVRRLRGGVRDQADVGAVFGKDLLDLTALADVDGVVPIGF